MARKTEFELMRGRIDSSRVAGTAIIITGYKDVKTGKSPISLIFTGPGFDHHLKPKDLERFAVNILKALNSKKLLSKEEANFVRTQKTLKRPLK